MTTKEENVTFNSVGSTSWEVERWVHDNSQLTGLSFLVAVVVARHHSRGRGYSYPSIETIAQKARVSQSTVHRAVKEMQSLGEWRVVRGRGGVSSRGTSSQANRYYPTALLAGVQAPSTRKRSTTLIEDTMRSLDLAGVNSASERIAIKEIVSALPEELGRELVEQIASQTPAGKLATLQRKINSLGTGIDWQRLIKDRYNATNRRPAIVISWLSAWALRHIDPEEYRTALDKEEYGETGEGF